MHFEKKGLNREFLDVKSFEKWPTSSHTYELTHGAAPWAGTWEFFLTGPLWASTVLGIYIRNIVHIHMKFHLPHIYMFLIESSKKMNIHFLQVCQSILQYSRTFQHFWDHARPTKPFGSNSLGPLKFLQRNFLLLLWL